MDRNAYIQDPALLIEKVHLCPICPAGAAPPLWRNGRYPRYFPGDQPGNSVLSWVYRKLCRRCRTSFSLHPEPLLKRQSYSLAFVAAWLWTFLTQGGPVRNRPFLESHSVCLPAEDPLLSWSDMLDQGERTQPGYQLLHRWATLFCDRAKVLVPGLVNAAVAAGVHRLSAGWKVPRKAYELQLTWLYWRALAELRASSSTVPAAEIFQQLVRQLSKVPSHKARRDARRRFPYDVLIL